MAPKGKEPAKPDAKAAPAGKGAEGGAAIKDPVLLAKNKKILIICGSIAILCFVLIIMLIGLCADLSAREQPTEHPFEQLKDTLAVAINKPRAQLDTAKKVADVLLEEGSSIGLAERFYNERRRKYRSLFYRPYFRSSSGPWHFHGNSLYYFSKEEKNWYDAEDSCISRGGHLASILDDEEQNYISAQLQHTSWIGLNAENEEGKWRWSDGSRLVKAYWSEDEPSNRRVFGQSNQDCAMMTPSLTYHNWKDNNCRKLYRWVCKGKLELIK